MEETNKIPQEWNKFYLKDVSFVNLMTGYALPTDLHAGIYH